MSEPRASGDEDVLKVLSRVRPDYQVSRVVELGEGTDHRAYEVNGELVVRFSTDPSPSARAASTRRQARLLTEVERLSPLPTPVPRLVLAEEGYLVYHAV